jgi:hypothetical protein
VGLLVPCPDEFESVAVLPGFGSQDPIFCASPGSDAVPVEEAAVWPSGEISAWPTIGSQPFRLCRRRVGRRQIAPAVSVLTDRA